MVGEDGRHWLVWPRCLGQFVLGAVVRAAVAATGKRHGEEKEDGMGNGWEAGGAGMEA